MHSVSHELCIHVGVVSFVEFHPLFLVHIFIALFYVGVRVDLVSI